MSGDAGFGVVAGAQWAGMMDAACMVMVVAGEGGPIVLLHPGFAESRIWDPQWPLYAARFHVVRCDLPGFGRSPVRLCP
ncbi:MAG: alpha/beta fold hydrolase [Solirubrobacteraceae bacterium]